MQAVIEAGIIAPLVHLLQNAEFDIKKEAAWAISNATSGGSPDQIKYACIILLYFALSIPFWNLKLIFLCHADFW